MWSNVIFNPSESVSKISVGLLERNVERRSEVSPLCYLKYYGTQLVACCSNQVDEHGSMR